MEKARLIIDPPASGAWNMAVDQAILETADQTGLITLRFYRWSEPTLSLGYFQNYLDRNQHPISEKCPLVRRRTGGGAIIHDQEITYSLCVPSANRWAKKNSQLYDTMHQLIIRLLASHEINSGLYGNDGDQSEFNHPTDVPAGQFAPGNLDPGNLDHNAFLCFQRRSPGDVILDDFKIAGSAQRRIRNALLQHGSILLHRSQFAPELPGIHDLASFGLSSVEMVQELANAAEEPLQIDIVPGFLSKTEKVAAEKAYSSQFYSTSWNHRR